MKVIDFLLHVFEKLSQSKETLGIIFNMQLKEWGLSLFFFFCKSFVFIYFLGLTLKYLNQWVFHYLKKYYKIYSFYIKDYKFPTYSFYCWLVLTSWFRVHLSNVSNASSVYIPSDTDILACKHFHNKLISGTGLIITLFSVIWVEKVRFGLLQ